MTVTVPLPQGGYPVHIRRGVLRGAAAVYHTCRMYFPYTPAPLLGLCGYKKVRKHYASVLFYFVSGTSFSTACRHSRHTACRSPGPASYYG